MVRKLKYGLLREVGNIEKDALAVSIDEQSHGGPDKTIAPAIPGSLLPRGGLGSAHTFPEFEPARLEYRRFPAAIADDLLTAPDDGGITAARTCRGRAYVNLAKDASSGRFRQVIR